MIYFKFWKFKEAIKVESVKMIYMFVVMQKRQNYH